MQRIVVESPRESTGWYSVSRPQKRWNRERATDWLRVALWHLEWAATLLAVWLIVGALILYLLLLASSVPGTPTPW